jgi:hypothetical protein
VGPEGRGHDADERDPAAGVLAETLPSLRVNRDAAAHLLRRAGFANLASLDSNGNRTIANDFRAYYGTILQDSLGADSAAILGSGYPNLGFLNRSYS